MAHQPATGRQRGYRLRPIRSRHPAAKSQPFLDTEKEAKVEGVSAVVTGVTPVVYKAERSLLEGLVESFFMAFVIMAAVMAVVYRSVPAGLLVMFPNVWPMALVFGLLGYSGVVVDIGTMMTASVAMGVSVDDAAHYITWFRFGIAKGYDRRTAAIYAYRNAAVAMAQSSIIVGFGLAVFGLSSFVPTRMFGLLMLLLLSWGLFADLVLMPAILAGPWGGSLRTASARNRTKSPPKKSHWPRSTVEVLAIRRGVATEITEHTELRARYQHLSRHRTLQSVLDSLSVLGELCGRSISRPIRSNRRRERDHRRNRRLPAPGRPRAWAHRAAR